MSGPAAAPHDAFQNEVGSPTASPAARRVAARGFGFGFSIALYVRGLASEVSISW